LVEKPVKKDSTLDLLTMMSDKVTVKFKVGPDKYETDTGRWCYTCKSVIAMTCRKILYSLGCKPETTQRSKRRMERARLSSKEGTRPAVSISVSIMSATKKNVTLQTWQSTIGPFHARYGRPWRRQKSWQSKAGKPRNRRSNCSPLKVW
jgi:hypothetical protein